MTGDGRDVAFAAWGGFAQDCATGDWSGLIDLLADDVVVFLPSGPFRGRNQGRDRFRKFADLVVTKGRLVFEPPIRTTQSGTTFVFEAWDSGEIGGKRIRNRIELSLDVAHGKVFELREYLGMVGG